MLIKAFIVAVLIAIVVSLASGLVFLIKDKGHTERTARALTWRISLSVSLFVLIMLGVALGYIKPHGLYAPGHPVTRSAPPATP